MSENKQAKRLIKKISAKIDYPIIPLGTVGNRFCSRRKDIGYIKLHGGKIVIGSHIHKINHKEKRQNLKREIKGILG